MEVKSLNYEDNDPPDSRTILYDALNIGLGDIGKRLKTTTGIWIAKCIGIEPIVMNLDGCDGRERGEVHRSVCMHSTFCNDIYVAQVVRHDIGRAYARSQPQLKAMTRLLNLRKMTLLFVICDKTKVWDSINKPEIHKSIALYEFFHVEVIALPNFEEKEEQFNEHHSIAIGGLVGDKDVLPASEFSFNSQQMWKIIKENKEPDLLAYKVMVATIRCEEIANEIPKFFAFDEAWLELRGAVHSGPMASFGQKVGSILDAYLAQLSRADIPWKSNLLMMKSTILRTLE